MSKAVLIMDMPNKCNECPLHEMSDDFNKIICVSMQESIDKFADKKPDWCPLKPMPSKKALNGDVTDIQKMGKELVDIGYNACIDELLKEE